MKCNRTATQTGFIEGQQFYFCDDHGFSDFQPIPGNSGVQCQRGDIVDLEEDAAELEAEFNRLRGERGE